MLNMNEINDKIQELENQDTTWKNCEMLSVLYTVRSHNDINNNVAVAQYVQPLNEFEEIATKISKEKLISVMSEHMETINILYPKEYEKICEKLLS